MINMDDVASFGYLIGQMIAIAASLTILGLILWLGAVAWIKFLALISGQERERRPSRKTRAYKKKVKENGVI